MDHDNIEQPPILSFSGHIYGDDTMEYLGKLKKIHGITIGGGIDVPDEKRYGSVTNEGVRRFVEAHTGDDPIGLTFVNQTKIDAKALEYLLNLKNMDMLQFRGVTPINWSDIKPFKEEFEKRHGIKLIVEEPTRWASEDD
jgi:hypothetical protein